MSQRTARYSQEMQSFLKNLATAAAELSVSLNRTADSLTEINADDLFPDGLLAVENFNRNVNTTQAMRLMARWAAAYNEDQGR